MKGGAGSRGKHLYSQQRYPNLSNWSPALPRVSSKTARNTVKPFLELSKRKRREIHTCISPSFQASDDCGPSNTQHFFSLIFLHSQLWQNLHSLIYYRNSQCPHAIDISIVPFLLLLSRQEEIWVSPLWVSEFSKWLANRKEWCGFSMLTASLPSY